jgi:ABC-type uncharacterized transport system ATPase subunit
MAHAPCHDKFHVLHPIPTLFVEATYLWERYGDRHVVHDASLAIAPGQLLGLVGPNGSEKATTIRIPLDIIPVNPDRAGLFGDPVSQETQARIGTTQSRSQPAWAF